jgi:predicted nucleic acid-binding protein
MIVLDAYALVAFLTGGPASGSVRALLRGGETAVAAINLAEALDVAQRVRGLPIDAAREALEPLLEDVVQVLPVDTAIAFRAAAIRARHYHRRDRPISLADAVLVAACGVGDRVATSDPDVLAVAINESVGTVELPAQG